LSQAAQILEPLSAEPSVRAPWYAVRTRSNHERVAAERLLAQGVEAYLPTMLARSRRRDRRAVVARPLFPGYFFARLRLDAPERVTVLKAPGVMHLVGFGGAPVSVPEWQVESVRRVLDSRRSTELLWRPTPGQRVRVAEGALSGAQGVVVTVAPGDQQLVISIDLLGRSLSVRVAAEELEPVT
jgi:transcription antitermination factor NusG